MKYTHEYHWIYVYVPSATRSAFTFSHSTGLDGSLVEDDGSLDYMSGLSNSSSGGLNAHGAPATSVTTPTAASVPATSLVTGGNSGGGAGGGGGSGGTTADYYGYDYDSRTYRLPSTLVGRNYLYPPTSVPLNQVIMDRCSEYNTTLGWTLLELQKGAFPVVSLFVAHFLCFPLVIVTVVLDYSPPSFLLYILFLLHCGYIYDYCIFRYNTNRIFTLG